MGINTTIVILNDALNDIANDKHFGRKLVDAIGMNYSTRKPVTLHAGNGNCGEVVVQCHASDRVIVEVGGNTATVLNDH